MPSKEQKHEGTHWFSSPIARKVNGRWRGGAVGFGRGSGADLGGQWRWHLGLGLGLVISATSRISIVSLNGVSSSNQCNTLANVTCMI
ncbi:hypothetical protein EPI10_010401 [Gossypium australe]|uniref:Uncharacterized protein n=1 Tax=Gossypium australe TaxID=47621 RepID=A0A5B6W5E1_9ROSI|nr:hypothetical protein EPI10_010401 [Gossypium australe]